MRRTVASSRGFTLLEVMIAGAIGVIVLAVGLVAGMQMQRRALFEEQTMMAQVTGRAVKDLLVTDLMRAGLGMGNAPIAFGDDDERHAIEVWTEPDLSQNIGTDFVADANFVLPPDGTAYENLRSDVLRMYWGETRGMVTMAPCNSSEDNGPIKVPGGGSANFCTIDDPPTDLAPPSGGPDTPAILVNPNLNIACHIEIQSINTSSDRINANPGASGNGTDRTECKADAHDTESLWREEGWMTMRTSSAAYRVNWAGGSPALEYQAPGQTNWVVVSRDVERMKIRQATVNLQSPSVAYRWFPDPLALPNPLPELDRCTVDTCPVDSVRNPATEPDDDDEDIRNLLRRRVRELEVTLTIRTKRADREAFDPTVPVTEVDDEGFPRDGFKRRTFTFRVTPRNFAAAGQQPPTGGGT